MFFGDDECGASAFHLKSFLCYLDKGLVAITGSGNLTAGGLEGNIEQFVEQVIDDTAAEARRHAERFEALWLRGLPLSVAKREGLWSRYELIYERRRKLDRAMSRSIGLRLRAERRSSQSALSRARASGAASGYIANTSPRWWDYVVANRLRGPAFWRSSTNQFHALRDGGFFFHLVNYKDGVRLSAQDRLLVGYSRYHLGYQVLSGREAWKEYGRSLGSGSHVSFREAFNASLEDRIGVIELHNPVEFVSPPTVRQLEAAGVPFRRQTVSGRRTEDAEIDAIFALAGARLPD